MVEEPTLTQKKGMSSDSLGELLRERYPNILPQVLDIYEKIFDTVPWEKDPIRGGYRLMDRDLKFLDEISKLLPPEAPSGTRDISSKPIEETLPPTLSEEKLHPDAPITPPATKANFSSLEAQLGSNSITINQPPRSGKTTTPISPKETELRAGTLDITIPVGAPNKSVAMAKHEQRKKDIENARRKAAQR